MQLLLFFCVCQRCGEKFPWAVCRCGRLFKHCPTCATIVAIENYDANIERMAQQIADAIDAEIIASLTA